MNYLYVFSGRKKVVGRGEECLFFRLGESLNYHAEVSELRNTIISELCNNNFYKKKSSSWLKQEEFIVWYAYKSESISQSKNCSIADFYNQDVYFIKYLRSYNSVRSALKKITKLDEYDMFESRFNDIHNIKE